MRQQRPDDRARVLRTHVGRDRELERPLHQCRVREPRQRVEVAVIALGLRAGRLHVIQIALIQRGVSADGSHLKHLWHERRWN